MAIPLVAAIGIGAMGMGLLTSFPSLANLLRQGSYLALPNELMPVAEAVEMRYRGLYTADEYRGELKAQGFKGKKADWIYSITENLLNAMELINLHRRGIIPKEELVTEAHKLKWTEDRIEKLLKVTEVIPSATDIILFAVREVYSPQIAEAFGQYEGAEDVFDAAKGDITAIGMSQDTFTKYWAAHWLLPSVGQGFEMMHRGVIPQVSTAAEPLGLDRLMLALDIMPAWREPLTAISFHPFTRVDVRRMHKIGTLTDEDLLRAYMDLGFDEEKAGKMVDFTIAYNAEPIDAEETEDDKDKAKERDLTKADVLNGYRDALLTGTETKDALALLGYDENEVNYYLSRIEYNKEKDETDDYLRYYHDAYIKRVMTHNDLVDKLGALNLSGKRIEYLFKIWDLERMARTNKPTKSELMTFLRKGVIDKPTFITEMEGLAYPQRYIDWYLKAG